MYRLAQQFGCHTNAIALIVRRHTYKDIPDEGAADGESLEHRVARLEQLVAALLLERKATP